MDTQCEYVFLFYANLLYVEGLFEVLDVAYDVAFAFFGIDVFYGDEYPGFFYVAELVVDGCAEYFHCG